MNTNRYENSDYTRTSEFANSVRNVVNDELFWRDIFQKYDVNEKVRNETNKILPDKVSSEVNKLIPTLVNSQLENYSKYIVPSLVSKSMSEQINNYLDNNNSMNKILELHSCGLNSKLESKADELLTSIVNDEKHHILTNKHIDSSVKKYNEQLEIINNDAKKNLRQNQENFNEELKNISEKVTREISTVSNANNRMDASDKYIKDLENRLQTTQNWFSVALVALAGVTLGGVYLLKK